jgi:Insertion element 4 transposase N-terminal
VAHNGVVAAGGRLTDWISLGVLASSVPRDAVDEAVAAAGKGARRSDGKLPPHVMACFAMALALFAEEDYEEVAARLTETLASWGCWDDSWSTPTSGGLTQARQRLGPEPASRHRHPLPRAAHHQAGQPARPSHDQLSSCGLVSRPNGLKLVKSGSVRGLGSRKARSRVGDAIGSGSHPVFTSKYLAAVATEG